MKTSKNTKIIASGAVKFDIDAKRFLLTFPMKDNIRSLERSQIIESFKEKFDDLKAKVEYICVAFEQGEEAKEEDGKQYEHLHVVLKLDRKTRIRDARFFDIQQVHGHYKPIDCKRNSWTRAVNYVQKDGNYEIWKNTAQIARLDEAPGNIVKLVEHLRGIKDEDKQALAISGLSTAADALYRLNKGRIDRAINMRDINGVKYEQCNFNIPQEVMEWNEKYRKLKALLLIGKSETGKTELAKALLKNPLFVSIKEDLKHFDPVVHDGLIFDDFSFNSMKKEDIIHLFDLENSRTFDVKFSHARIPFKVERIFTSNKSLNELLGYQQLEEVPNELMRRVVVCAIDADMRKNS